MITVFYDGKCSLCSKEIKYYQKIAPKGEINWCDISHDPSPLIDRGISQQQGLLFFHVEDEDGDMHIALDAFITLWHKLAGWRYLARLVSLPLIKPLVNYCYKLFAHYRFKKNGYCKVEKS